MRASHSRATWALGLLAASRTTALVSKRELLDFNWTSVAPSEDLRYHDCYGGYKCARLQVPLDWTKVEASGSSGHTNNSQSQWVAIAIITLPATVPDSDPSFGGPVLVNPGGPSGSGAEMTLDYGRYLQGVVDSGERHYEILGFDPRGTGWSTPRAECYGDDLSRFADFVQRAGMPPATSPEGLPLHFQAAAGGVKLCAEAGKDSIFAHMSTASVARDMLEIVERADTLRRRNSTGDRSASGSPKQAKLQYLGFSYGSYLGNTFASMFPGRVGRLVVDGIADPDDFVRGDLKKNINDAEPVVNAFYRTCLEAGDLCLLRQPQDKSAADVRRRVDAFIRSIEKAPVSAVHEGRVRLITSVLVRETIRQALYAPAYSAYGALSLALAGSLRGNHTLLLSADFTTLTNRKYTPLEYTWFVEAGMGVFCGDSAADAGTRDEAWARQAVAYYANQSFTTGEAWARLPLSCSGDWPFKPKYAFRGPFGSPAPGSKPADRAPAAPLLILSPRYDHATALANAYAMSRRHSGSAVVVQESTGHCALLTSSSECTRRIVREYFKSGRVPPNGTTCKEDCSPSIPFKSCPGLGI